MELIIDVLGWVGSILIVSAYWLNSKNRINAQSPIYQLLNIFGSLSLLINTFYYSAYPSSSVNLIWLFIGLFHITKTLKNKHQKSQKWNKSY